MSRIPTGGLLMQPQPEQIPFTPIMLPSDQLMLFVASQAPPEMTAEAAASWAVERTAAVAVAAMRGDLEQAVKRLQGSLAVA